jgi:hypothetical protein
MNLLLVNSRSEYCWLKLLNQDGPFWERLTTGNIARIHDVLSRQLYSFCLEISKTRENILKVELLLLQVFVQFKEVFHLLYEFELVQKALLLCLFVDNIFEIQRFDFSQDLKTLSLDRQFFLISHDCSEIDICKISVIDRV